MDSSNRKLYHKDGFDSRQHLEQYLSEKSEVVFGEDFLIFPIENLRDVFMKGNIKGDVLIDLSMGSLVHHLYSACEFFKYIIVLKVRDRCILELKRWLNTRTGAFEWGHATKLHVCMERNSDQVQNSEGKVRSAVNHVMKCDIEKENIMDPMVLPPADCIISAWLLDVISRTKDDYIKYLRRFSKLLKPRGHIILVGDLEISFFTVGKDKMHALTYDEDFARKALVGEGFVIDYCKVMKRTAVSDLIDHKAIIFIAAHKEKDHIKILSSGVKAVTPFVIQDYMMDSSNRKLYHKDGFDSRQHLEHYFSEKSEVVFGEDFLIFPIENLRDVFVEGNIKGDILIDLSIGSMVHHLYSACEFFKYIIVLKVKDRCILELKRWLNTRTGAFEWGHATKLHVCMERNSDQVQNSEGKVRSAVNHVMKCDLEKENMMDPMVLPPADCIISVWLLEIISRTKDDYIKYLRRFSKLLKPGGHIILIGALEISFYTVGKDKLHALTYDEEFVRKALVGEGFVIDYCKVKKRTAVSDLIDHKAILFIAAHKEK